MTEHELLQIAEHVERWYDEDAGVGHPTGTFAEYIGRLLSHIGRVESENERLKETALTQDAERWRALITSPRVSMLGGARFHQPDWLLAVEFYADEALSGSARAETIEALIAYADMRRRISSTSEETS